MKKIYYLEKHPVKIGDVIEHNGFRVTVTEELIKFNPELFVVENPMKELLDKAKRDYPIGTMFNSKYGIQKILSDEPFIGRVIPGTIQINTDKFPGGGTIYTPENGWSKILHLKFTTEDGVSIYRDMKTYLVSPNDDSANIDFSHSSWYGNSECKGYKYFYHKENALAYIEKHKEKTLEDYESNLFESMQTNVYSSNNRHYFSVWSWIKDNEPKLYYTKILQLIADDLNDGRYIHIRGNTSYHLSNARSVNVHCGDDEGCVYFKSRELVEKARVILGDKVKYLFN